MIYACLEIIRLTGWTAVLFLSIRYKRCTDIDVFWIRMIGSVLMMMGSIRDLSSVGTIHFKSLWWFFGNVFIIASYIYMIIRDVKDYRHINDIIKDIKKLDDVQM